VGQVPNEERIAQLFQAYVDRYDANGDGKIQVAETKSARTQALDTNNDGEVSEKADADKDGAITVEELARSYVKK
jgi:Ca2+-binding EF-hand superfamily protein